MTLVLSAHKRDTVFQVGDRLVSVALGSRLQPWDVMTNKTVVYLSTDGIAAIGFSGRARLEGKRTDLWIVEQLVGMDLDDDGSLVFFDGGRGPKSVYVALGIIREEAERVFTALRRERHTRHSFVFSGWQRRRRDEAQPFLWRLDNSTHDPDTFEMSNLLRDSPDWLHKVSVTPVGTFSEPDMATLLQDLEGTHSRESFEDELIGAIRKTASRFSGIGKDCLSVQIRPDVEPNVRTRFVPLASSVFSTGTMRGETRSLPYVFSPWLVGHGAAMPPNLMVGQAGMFGVGGLTCAFDSPITSDSPGYGLSMHSVNELRRAIYGPSRS